MAVEREAVRARLHALGFDEVRFARVEPGFGPRLSDWIAAGYHADMNWMERSVPKRSTPSLVLPGARSVIMLGVNYLPPAGAVPGALGAAPDGGAAEVANLARSSATVRPAWARYALYDDYHDTIKAALVDAGKVLEELGAATAADYRYYVDTGPVIERGWAAKSGLGFIGKNGMLISRQHGNWLFLAAVLTTLEFEPDAPVRKEAAGREVDPGLLCGKCTRCMDACPTQALPKPGVVDARRCVSYQTIENKGIIPRELRAGIGHRIYGCDTCLEVCPWNRFAQAGRQVLLAARYGLADILLRELLELTPERFTVVFKGTPIKRVKLAGLLRNACIVAANTEALECLDSLVGLAGHALPVVRAHAVWAVRRMGWGERLRELQAVEVDVLVLAEYSGVV
jgi:epoxyqueuosine reductase